MLGERPGDLVRRDGPDPRAVVLEAPQQSPRINFTMPSERRL